MRKKKILVESINLNIKVDSSNNRIKSKIKANIDFIPERSEIFDNSFGQSFN